jgi:hypothetical protein
MTPHILNQCLSPLEVGGVEAFGEPAIAPGQELAGCGSLALLPPQATQPHWRRSGSTWGDVAMYALCDPLLLGYDTHEVGDR